MTIALWTAIGVLLIIIALLLRRLARAEGRVAYLERKLAQTESELAGLARSKSVPPPVSGIEQLAGEDPVIDPVGLSRRALELGQREARGLLNVVGRLTNRPLPDDKPDKNKRG